MFDFHNGDKLDLSDFGFGKFGAVEDLAAERGGDTIIDFGGGDQLRLIDFALANFNAADVIL